VGGYDTRTWTSLAHSVLVNVRERLRRSARRDQIFDATLEAVRAAGLIGRRRLLDSTPLYDAVLPIVPNGLALCKIHHAAYDHNLIGVRPDLRIEVRRDVRHEIDGPILLYGIRRSMVGGSPFPGPEHRGPDPGRLEERYEEFRRAG
jgi:putative restriction endonuclease